MIKNCFIRKTDHLGRIVLPMEIRKKMEINENCPLEITSDFTSIIIKRHEKSCFICNSKRDLFVINNKSICLSCINSLYNKINHSI